MKTRKIDRLGGKLSYVDALVPDVRPGSVLVQVESQSLMSVKGGTSILDSEAHLRLREGESQTNFARIPVSRSNL